MDPNDNEGSTPFEPNASAPATRKKSEDTADGCRSLAKDDIDRAGESDSDHMRARLAHSAETWTARADMLQRLEGNRARIEAELGQRVINSGPASDEGEGQ